VHCALCSHPPRAGAPRGTRPSPLHKFLRKSLRVQSTIAALAEGTRAVRECAGAPTPPRTTLTAKVNDTSILKDAVPEGDDSASSTREAAAGRLRRRAVAKNRSK